MRTTARIVTWLVAGIADSFVSQRREDETIGNGGRDVRGKQGEGSDGLADVRGKGIM